MVTLSLPHTDELVAQVSAMLRGRHTHEAHHATALAREIVGHILTTHSVVKVGEQVTGSTTHGELGQQTPTDFDFNTAGPQPEGGYPPSHDEPA